MKMPPLKSLICYSEAPRLDLLQTWIASRRCKPRHIQWLEIENEVSCVN